MGFFIDNRQFVAFERRVAMLRDMKAYAHLKPG
jgi:hypothetical protein